MHFHSLLFFLFSRMMHNLILLLFKDCKVYFTFSCYYWRKSLAFSGCKLGPLLMCLSYFISNDNWVSNQPWNRLMVCYNTVPVVAHSPPDSQLCYLRRINFAFCLWFSPCPSFLCKLKALLEEADKIYYTRLCLAQQDTDLGWSFLAMQWYRYYNYNKGFTQKDQ